LLDATCGFDALVLSKCFIHDKIFANLAVNTEKQIW